MTSRANKPSQWAKENPRYGGVLLDNALDEVVITKKKDKKVGMSRVELWLQYRELCEELGIEPKSQDAINKWLQGRFDPPSLDFSVLASVLNDYLPARKRLPLAGVKGTRL